MMTMMKIGRFFILLYFENIISRIDDISSHGKACDPSRSMIWNSCAEEKE